MSKPGYKKTFPIDFDGRRWWLTKEKMDRLKLLQQRFPKTWKLEVYQRMDDWVFGCPERAGDVC
jgi:hypothetical protein